MKIKHPMVRKFLLLGSLKWVQENNKSIDFLNLVVNQFDLLKSFFDLCIQKLWSFLSHEVNRILSINQILDQDIIWLIFQIFNLSGEFANVIRFIVFWKLGKSLFFLIFQRFNVIAKFFGQ